MNRIRNIIAISAFSLMVLALPGVASAQWGGNNYPNNPNANRGYNNNLRGVARDLRERSRDFERQVDRELNNSRYGNRGGILGGILSGGVYGENRGYGNDRIKRLAEGFRRAANDFDNRVDDRDDRNGRYDRDNNRGQQSAMRLLQIGSELDREVRRMRLPRGLEYQWAAIRRDLNIVSNAYGNYGRGNQNRLPF